LVEQVIPCIRTTSDNWKKEEKLDFYFISKR
jgi:hypothetical protein